MITGEFVNGDRAMVSAGIAWNNTVRQPSFILDTGFTGDLVVTPDIAHDIGLEITGATPARMATNAVVLVPTATAFGVMEGMTVYVTVLITEGAPLLGISFLEKFRYKAIVDCRNKEVLLERMA